jgi:putative ubiquitin-RnfH superfamily antitoxin RatB of RatAB toxin-antitoxin module
MAEQVVACEIAYARADRQFIIPLSLSAGTTAHEALLRSGLLTLCPEIEPQTAVLGVFGRAVGAEYQLVEGDRLEIYRPLINDPKAARRARAKQAKTRR